MTQAAVLAVTGSVRPSVKSGARRCEGENFAGGVGMAGRRTGCWNVPNESVISVSRGSFAIKPAMASPALYREVEFVIEVAGYDNPQNAPKYQPSSYATRRHGGSAASAPSAQSTCHLCVRSGGTP